MAETDLTPDRARLLAQARQRQIQLQAATAGPARLYPGITVGADQPALADVQGAPQGRVGGADVRDPVRGDPTAMTAVADNVVGLDNGVMSPGEKLAAALNNAGESLTLGLGGDEFNAGIDAALGRGTYDERVSRYRDNQAQFAEENPWLSLASEVAPAFIPGLGIAGAAGRAASIPGRVVTGLLSGGAAGGLYGFMEGEGGAQERTDNAVRTGLLSGLMGAAIPAAGAAVGAVARRPAVRRAIEAIPGVDELKARAGRLYDEARQTGATAQPEAVTNLVGRLRSVAGNEGLIDPTGAVSPMFPRVQAVLSHMENWSGAEMNPTEMLRVRKLLGNAAKSADPDERRIASQMLQEFDAFTDPLAPQIRAANATYRDAMQGDLIDQTMELARIRAGQFTGSGMENAIRTEFRTLARRIEKGQLRVRPEEEALIRRIAEGGRMENLLRDIGKAAPRGIVSTGLGTSVPYMIGNSIGGPPLGGLLAAGTLAAGELGRRAATAMQTRNAEMLSAVARNGGRPLEIPQTGGERVIGLLEAMAQGVNPILSEDRAGAPSR